jgi:hypothetical protein
MFCYFVSDPKVTGIRKPEAEGIYLTLRVEQMDGLHDLTTYQYNIHTQVQNTIVGQCRTNPWPAVPVLEWTWCRNADAGLTQLTNRKNGDAGLTFSAVFWHSGIVPLKELSATLSFAQFA